MNWAANVNTVLPLPRLFIVKRKSGSNGSLKDL
jgi:hypothetical protein